MLFDLLATELSWFDSSSAVTLACSSLMSFSLAYKICSISTCPTAPYNPYVSFYLLALTHSLLPSFPPPLCSMAPYSMYVSLYLLALPYSLSLFVLLLPTIYICLTLSSFTSLSSIPPSAFTLIYLSLDSFSPLQLSPSILSFSIPSLVLLFPVFVPCV